MFGLTQVQERLVLTLAFILLFIGYSWYERHKGASECLGNVAKANAVEQKKENIQHTADVGVVQREGQKYVETIGAPLTIAAPVIRLCPALSGETVSATASAGPEAHAEASVRGGDTEQSTFWDSTPVVKAGRDANAQIAGLQEYITKVCRPK
jgi:hypothetical protein